MHDDFSVVQISTKLQVLAVVRHFCPGSTHKDLFKTRATWGNTALFGGVTPSMDYQWITNQWLPHQTSMSFDSDGSVTA
jgi:hypothetical protein